MDDNGEDFEDDGLSDEEVENDGEDAEDDAVMREKNGMTSPRQNI